MTNEFHSIDINRAGKSLPDETTQQSFFRYKISPMTALGISRARAVKEIMTTNKKYFPYISPFIVIIVFVPEIYLQHFFFCFLFTCASNQRKKAFNQRE